MIGIVLKTIPYGEDGKILKLFTKESGILSVIVKKLKRKETYLQTVTSPLAQGEYHLSRRQSDLYVLNDASLIDAYFDIRNNLDKLDAACTILRALLTSQYPEKPSPDLYLLTATYLKKLKSFSNPLLLALSFQMKLLNYEGLFPDTKEYFNKPLSSDEWLTLECLCHAKHFDLLQALTLTPALQEKATELFATRISEFS